VELSNWIGFCLDNVLYRGFRRQKIQTPVFIIGNFRSGSTFLHRLMAKDDDNFTCFRTWEVYLAPSVTQRRLYKVLGKIDSLLGQPLGRVLDWVDQKYLHTIKMHRTGLKEPEEDEGLFLHIWSSFLCLFMFPGRLEESALPYCDTLLSPWQRKWLMRFYRNCLKRHLYAHGGKGIILSKNPSFCFKMAALLSEFPDAKIVYVARNMYDMLPSVMNWFSFGWYFCGSPLETHPYKEFILSFTRDCYLHPLRVLKNTSPSNYLILRYREIVRDPVHVIREIYRHFNWKMSDGYAERIKEAEGEAKHHKGQNRTTIEDLGYSREQVQMEYGEVIEEYPFSIENS
jgi:hypothetical protein